MCHGMVAHPYSNNVIELEKTMYGSCEKNGVYRCAVYSNSCENDELWLSPIELEQIGKPGCTCDKVHVGSCLNPFSDQCVVDSDSCDTASDFISSFATKQMGKECLLCSSEVFEEKNPNVLLTPSGDDDTPYGDEEKALDDDTYKTVPQQINNNDVSKKAFGVALGFMVAGLTTSLILGVFIVLKKKESKGGVQADKSGSVL